MVVLIDEYDVPVMAGHTYGYYDEVAGFLKGWLTGALKDGGAALAFACLTGVQRISKESVFSDLNNLTVSTPLSQDFDERYGFTDAEVQALAAYLGHPGRMDEAREWYDGYRFGRVDVYNPWSVLNYLRQGCSPDVDWGNTSSNSVVGELVADEDAPTLEGVYSLVEPGGTVLEPLDLGIVFPEVGVRRDAVWSMLYLAGYLTTEDVERPNDRLLERRLRVPNREVRQLYRAEIVDRFARQAGGRERLKCLQASLVSGDERAFGEELGRIVCDSMSYHDLADEGACHALLMGLLFGTRGYRDPVSNREAGHGRYDIRLEPDTEARPLVSRPLVTLELKRLAPGRAAEEQDAEALEAQLQGLAVAALGQIEGRAYDAALPPGAVGRLRWGVAFCGKRVAVACGHA